MNKVGPSASCFERQLLAALAIDEQSQVAFGGAAIGIPQQQVKAAACAGVDRNLHKRARYVHPTDRLRARSRAGSQDPRSAAQGARFSLDPATNRAHGHSGGQCLHARIGGQGLLISRGALANGGAVYQENWLCGFALNFSGWSEALWRGHHQLAFSNGSRRT